MAGTTLIAADEYVVRECGHGFKRDRAVGEEQTASREAGKARLEGIIDLHRPRNQHQDDKNDRHEAANPHGCAQRVVQNRPH